MEKGCHLHDYDMTWRTHACSGNMTMWVGQCVESCSEGFYQFGAECLACAQGCKRCIGSDQQECLECETGYVFDYRSVCVKSCSMGEYSSPNSDCTSCNSECKACVEGFETSCTKCPSGSTLRPFSYSSSNIHSGYCIPDTPSGLSQFFRQLPNDNIMFQCPSSCLTCVNKYLCLTCASGYFLWPPADSGANYASCLQS